MTPATEEAAPRKRSRIAARLAFCFTLLACGPPAVSAQLCRETGPPILLPRALDETSGVALSAAWPRVYWTHEDDGSVLTAIDPEGEVLARFDVRPQLLDWEDLALAECESGWCLYLADTGDNAEQRAPGDARVLRIPEPDPFSVAIDRPLRGDLFSIRLPDGPRDIEALLVFPGERVYLVTKGRNHAVTVYRYPGPLRPGPVTVEEVQKLTERPPSLANWVTGGSVAPGGGWAALRSYQTLTFYRFEGDTLAALDDGRVNLRTLREPQGEGVALGPQGSTVLTSEGGLLGGRPSMNVLRCALPG